MVRPAHEGRYHEGLRDGKASYDGVGELAGIGEVALLEVAGEEDAPGLMSMKDQSVDSQLIALIMVEGDVIHC